MGGTIGVDSNLGSGSIFWFEVPLREVSSEDRQPGAARSAAAAPRRRVLLAEDNDINQDIISAMLEQRGHAVTVVADGAAAVAAVRAGPRFAIILMDLQMPVMDGLTATRAIRTEETQAGERPTPIVGLTANAMAEDVVRCREAGMDAHVAKPIEWSDLFVTIERLTEAGPDLDVLGRPDDVPEIDVLDEATLDALAGYVGRERLEEMLGAFAREVEARVSDFDAATRSEIAGRAHALVSLAGQLGFNELSRRLRRSGDRRTRRDRSDPDRRGSVGCRPCHPGGSALALYACGLTVSGVGSGSLRGPFRSRDRCTLHRRSASTIRVRRPSSSWCREDRPGTRRPSLRRDVRPPLPVAPSLVEILVRVNQPSING